MLVAVIMGSGSLVAETARPAVVRQDTRALHGTLSTIVLDDGHLISVARPDRPTGQWVWYCLGAYWSATEVVASTPEGMRYANSFLDAGLTLVSQSVQGHGSKASADLLERVYQRVTVEFTLAPKARLFAQSRGGLDAYGYAWCFPEHVDRIAGTFPVSDWFDWPGVDIIPNTSTDVRFTQDELARLRELNPIGRLAALAARHIPILHVHGDTDTVVHIGPNSLVLAERYRALGGEATIVVIRGGGHTEIGFYRSELDAFIRK